jgi:hypothetical protein
LDEITEHKSKSDHKDPAWSHQTGRDWNQTGPIEHAGRADVTDHPICDWNAGYKRGEIRKSLDPPIIH